MMLLRPEDLFIIPDTLTSERFVDNLLLVDGIVLYTDGIPEAYNVQKQQYGLDRFCRTISQSWQGYAAAIQRSIINDLQQFIGTQKVFDDITLLVLKQQPTGQGETRVVP